MNAAIWRSLLWKEWREHRWKLAALVSIAIGLNLWALKGNIVDHRDYAWPAIAMLWIVLPISSILVATGIAAGEESQRTASFLKSLPISIRSAAIAKLAASTLTVVAAQAFGLMLTRALLRVAEEFNWASRLNSTNFLREVGELYDIGDPALAYLLVTFLIGFSLILWVAAPAVNSKSEVRAGSIGLIVVVACWTAFAWGLNLLSDDGNLTHLGPMGKTVAACIAAMLPGGIWIASATLERVPGQAPYLVIPYLLSHVPLAWWYITRLGHTDDRERARLNDAVPLVAPAPAWLGPARRSPLTALLWKHARECAPIVLAGAIGAVGVAVTIFCTEYPSYANNSMRLLEITSGSVMAGFMVLGCCAGIVCGAGVLTSELEPRLYAFWRTRPISIDLWFAIAFLGGLALLVVVFGVPVAVAYQFALADESSNEPPLSMMFSILMLSYVSGAFTASFVRNAVYASLLGLGVMAFAFAGVMYAVAWVADRWLDVPNPDAWLGVATLAFSAVLGLAAWVCVRNDWSLRLS